MPVPSASFLSVSYFSCFASQTKPKPLPALASHRNDPPRQRPLDGRRRRRRRRRLPARSRRQRRGARLLPGQARVPARGDGAGVLPEAEPARRGRALEEASVEREREESGGGGGGGGRRRGLRSFSPFLCQNCKRNEKKVSFFSFSFPGPRRASPSASFLFTKWHRCEREIEMPAECSEPTLPAPSGR